MDIRDYLADIFLDTEFSEKDAKYIARGCIESGLSIEEIEHILINEVALVCLPHLASGVGPWAGWPEGWVQKKLQEGNPMEIWKDFDFEKNFKELISEDWEKVKYLIINKGT